MYYDRNVKKRSFLISAVISLCLLFMGCSSSAAQKTPTVWYAGGTLHNTTYAAWKKGDDRNKLATAADWITAFEGFGAPEEIRVKAERLVICIDETAVSAPQTTRTHEVAQRCYAG